MIELQSSWIAGYDRDKTSRTLTLYTRDGKEIIVPNATDADAIGLAHAYSAGRYFNDNLKHRVQK